MIILHVLQQTVCRSLQEDNTAHSIHTTGPQKLQQVLGFVMRWNIVDEHIIAGTIQRTTTRKKEEQSY